MKCASKNHLGISFSLFLLAPFIAGSASAVPFSVSYSAQYSGIPLSNALNIATGHAMMNACFSRDGWGSRQSRLKHVR